MTAPSTNVVKAELCIMALNDLISDMDTTDRKAVFDIYDVIGSQFCLSCGYVQRPNERPCQCENDE